MTSGVEHARTRSDWVAEIHALCDAIEKNRTSHETSTAPAAAITSRSKIEVTATDPTSRTPLAARAAAAS
jgi:hypothetical protein